MRSIAVAFMCATLCGALAVVAAAEEKPVLLKKAPGLEKVESNCAICHTLDYIRMNSPFLTAAGWDAEVAKMINAYGAPISPSDAKNIGDYLKSNYGRDARG
jgi:sulfite dehydrogenase (cytochrome) subunit B